jgi:type II secretory ATPase GspE/PulE/Tfp pilus assembly ATPase PilB-like protein/RNA polymerase subunit RPABC4/transcription elongation factor Spt4
MRQDPDVILVGEVRDFETADTAFKAALTGHMVLTSLHTNSAVASITRLIDMGIKPYILASALEGIVAQRLVRRICDNCREEVVPDPEQSALLRVPEGFFAGKVFCGAGCARCNNTGYKGRLGVFEIFLMSDEYRQLIGTSYKESEILTIARANGMRSLLEDGLEKVRQGLTTMDEILRVVGPAVRMERHCDHCGKLMESRHLFCPYCGSFRQNCCRSCHQSIDDDWTVCPACGTARLP